MPIEESGNFMSRGERRCSLLRPELSRVSDIDGALSVRVQQSCVSAIMSDDPCAQTIVHSQHPHGFRV
jgi:hypothetical protein